MEQKPICSICGKPVASSAPEGLCPECLLKAGLGTGVDIGSDTGGKTPRFTPPKIEELATKFPQLEILEFVGQGGMGAVYKARQKQLDRIVALKVLPSKAGGPAFAERFTREARALARLNHPHIVTLYEFGQSDGLFYFLMEFVNGVNLRQLLGNSRISPREALAIVPQICEALQFAHDSGIVHRDIKPENILLDKKGQVKIADFGVAKMIAESLTEAVVKSTPAPGELTEAGSTLGTPQYMAPEQFKNSAEVDHRADIYSLGVVFYQMLTGELPSGRIEPPSRKVQIDVRLDEIVLRALEKKPEMRFQQAGDVKTAVETIATTLQRPPPEPARGFKHYKDTKWNFELDIPEGWSTLPPDLKNSPAELLRFASNENGRHLLIIFLGPSHYFSLKDASDWAQKRLATAGFGNFASAETTIGGKSARTLDFNRLEGDHTWNCRHYFIKEGATGFVLGFGTTDKTGMFEAFDRMAQSFRFQPSGHENPPKPYFPKTKTAAPDELKSESSGQKAGPELVSGGYTVRIEPVSPPHARRFDTTNVSALLANIRAAMTDPAQRFEILRAIFIVAFAVQAIVILDPAIALVWRSVPDLLNTIKTGRLANYFEVLNSRGKTHEVVRLYSGLGVTYLAPYLVIALAVFYPRRWVFVFGSIFAIYQFLFYPLGPLNTEIQLNLSCILLINIARAMALAGFWVKPRKPSPEGRARRFGMGAVLAFLAIVLAATVISLSVVHSVSFAHYTARMRAGAQLNVLFHVRVFEADAGLVDQLIPVSERRNGAQPNIKSVYAQGVREINTYSQGNFHMTTHVAETESQFAPVSPVIVRNLLQGITAKPGVLVDQTNLVSGLWWQTGLGGLVCDWVYSVASSHLFGNGGGNALLGVWKTNGCTEVRIDGRLNHSVDMMIPKGGLDPLDTTTSRFLYEGMLPQTNELVFLVPFLRNDGSQHYLVTVFDFNGENKEEAQRALLNGPSFKVQLHQATVELAAVGDPPWTNPVCWYPNGKPSPKSFPTGQGSFLDSETDWKKLAIYVRNNSTNDVSVPICHASDSTGVSSVWGPPYFGVSVYYPSNTLAANLSIGVANGPWETVVSMDHPHNSISGEGTGDDNWSGTYESVAGKNGDVAIGCSYTTRSNWVSRIVYVNGSGHIVPISERSDPGGFSNPTTSTLLISSNEFAHIKQFLVQRRKCQWVEFDNVSLQQGHLTSVTAKVY